MIKVLLKKFCSLNEFHVKIFAVFFALITPFVMVTSGKVLGSISRYWDTPYQPLFIMSNIICSYFFFSLKNWKIPSLFLILVTSFNHYEFNLLHNIFAVSFYFACLHSLFKNKRFIIYRFLFILSISIYPYSIILGEIVSIVILCLYHLTVILYTKRLIKKKTLHSIKTKV